MKCAREVAMANSPNGRSAPKLNARFEGDMRKLRAV
jgi:hypothetical protein